MTADFAILLLIALLTLDILIVVTRSSLVNAHLPRLLNLRTDHERAVDLTIQRMERPRVRVSLRIAHVLCLSILIFVFLVVGLASYPIIFQMQGWVIVLILVFTVLVALLESVFDGLVLRDPEGWALRVSGFAAMIDFIISPVSMVAIRLMNQTETSLQQISAPTDDELKTWVKQGQVDGALEKEEREMIYSIFQFGDTLAREIMVPRIDMTALDVETSISDALKTLVDSGHSRVPVYEGTIDNIIGLLYAKDLLRHFQHPELIKSIREKLRPVYFIPEAKKLDELLTDLQTKRVHMAIVVDEYGGVAGLVTLEDIIEEIIGEIQDEYDQSEELPYTRISDTEFLFKGSIDLDDFNEVMGTQIPKENTDTLGGFMYSEIGKVPSGGEIIQLDQVKLVVEHVLGRRIRKVRALRLLDQDMVEDDHAN